MGDDAGSGPVGDLSGGGTELDEGPHKARGTRHKAQAQQGPGQEPENQAGNLGQP